MFADETPAIRVNAANPHAIDPGGDYVVYWMVAARRARYNFGLQYATELAQKLNKPLVILEALRVGYQWSSERMHTFVLQGMAANEKAFKSRKVTYFPYVESQEGEGRGLVEALAGRSCAVVVDEFPCFFLPRMVAATAEKLSVPLVKVDSNGLLPLREPARDFTTAASFRRHLQKNLAPHLETFPKPDPLRGVSLPKANLPSLKRWPRADLQDVAGLAASLPLDASVKAAALPGGGAEATKRYAHFVEHKLARYGAGRNQPEDEIQSGMSPYLHFGHISTHEMLHVLFERDDWSLGNVAPKATGSREGWWGLSKEGESFIDELVTWRELGYNFTFRRPRDYDQLESLPAWAQQTIQDHAADPREYVYSLEQFDRAGTHDPLWNAAQNQLVQEGRIHNYLRMLWGKKIYEWSATAQDALDVLIELNNRYALDGRNPNSYSGIFWILGRFDRAWGPERPVFGKLRYMSSDNTARKVRTKEYVKRFSNQTSLL